MSSSKSSGTLLFTGSWFPAPPTLVNQGPAKVRRSSERLQVVPVSVFSLQGGIKHHTYRMRGRRCRTQKFRSRPCDPSGDAEIAARSQDASSTRTEQVTNNRHKFQRSIRPLNTVPQADRLRDASLFEGVDKPPRYTSSREGPKCDCARPLSLHRSYGSSRRPGSDTPWP